MHFLFHLGALVAASSLALAGSYGGNNARGNARNNGNSRGGNNGNAYGGNSGGGGKADDPIAMLCAVNKERQRAGRKPLGLDPKLVAAAVAHSKDQARTRKMSHTGSDGSKPSARVKKAGYNYKSTGENVAYGQKNVAEVMKDWMGSPGHKKNILDSKFTHFGSSVQYSGSTPYWTQEFGSGGASGAGTIPKCDGSDAYTPVGGGADAGGDYGGGDDMGGAGYGGGDEPSSGGGSGGGKRRGGSRGGSQGDQGGDYGSDEQSSGGKRRGGSRGGDEQSSGGRRGGSRGGDYGGDEMSSGGRRGQQGGRRGQQGGRRGGQQDGAYGGAQQRGRQQGGRRGQQDSQSRRGGSRRGGEQQQGRRQGGGDRRGGRSGGGSDY